LFLICSDRDGSLKNCVVPAKAGTQNRRRQLS
jgi:hypothetical protein